MTADAVLELLERLKKRFKCRDDKPKGLSNEMAEEIRSKILGIKPDTEEERKMQYSGADRHRKGMD